MGPDGPSLEGPRVRLRPLAEGDLTTIYRWYEDPEVASPYDRYAWEGFEEFRAAVAASADDTASLAPRFVVERRDGGPPLGCVGAFRSHPVLTVQEVWYLIGDRAARGAGLGTEAVGLLVDHLFRTTAVDRVGATSDVENLASRRLAEKLGMRLEGTLRSVLYHHARWHDVALYGITRADWQARGRAPGRA